MEWKVIAEMSTKTKESEAELEFYDFDAYARLVVAVARKLDPRSSSWCSSAGTLGYGVGR